MSSGVASVQAQHRPCPSLARLCGPLPGLPHTPLSPALPPIARPPPRPPGLPVRIQIQTCRRSRSTPPCTTREPCHAAAQPGREDPCMGAGWLCCTRARCGSGVGWCRGSTHVCWSGCGCGPREGHHVAQAHDWVERFAGEGKATCSVCAFLALLPLPPPLPPPSALRVLLHRHFGRPGAS